MGDGRVAGDRISQLRRRLAELVADAPDLSEVLRGTVGQRYVRCGKKGCHCQDGEGHGPVYYLSVSLGAGRTKQVTLTRESHETAGRYARNYARLREILEEAFGIHRELLQEERRAARRRPASPDAE